MIIMVVIDSYLLPYHYHTMSDTPTRQNLELAIRFEQENNHYTLSNDMIENLQLMDTDPKYNVYYESSEDEIVFRRCSCQRPINTVYHYCSVDTLKSIVKSQHVRMTDPTCMNDSKELIWAFNVISNVLNKVGESIIFREIDDNWINTAYDQIYCNTEEEKVYVLKMTNTLKSKSMVDRKKFLLESLKEMFLRFSCDAEKSLPKIGQIYVACFSLKHDHLGQWRGYGDDGQGVSIGFNVQWLQQFGLNQREVTYHDRNQQQEIGMFLRNFEFNRANGLNWWLSIAPFQKSYEFHEESEYRAAYFTQQKPTLCPGTYRYGKDIRKFFEIPLLHDSISSITLGPKCSTDEVALARYLTQHGMHITTDKIRQSNLTYR